MTIYLKRIFILALLILSACLDLHSSIIFTTALKDIGRNCWDHYQRSNDTYIERFLKLAQNISYPLIAYLEKPLLEKVSSYTFPENVIFIDMECVDTFYDTYYEREKQIIESPEYKKKAPQNRWNNPEHKYAEYTLITHSKCNFVAKTKKLYPDFTFYAWIDFGCIYHIDNVPQDLFLPEDLLKNKITFPLLKKPEPQHRLTEEKMLGIDDIYIDGSQYIIHKNLVFLYEDLYRKKIEMWQSLKTCDDDQNLVYQLYMDDPELFFLVEEKHWFTLFYHFRKKIKNMQIKTYKTSLVTPLMPLEPFLDTYLPYLEEKSIFVITSKIVSLSEGCFFYKKDTPSKKELVKHLADAYLEDPVYNNLTLKQNLLLPCAGIDESNAQDMYIAYPKDPQKSAERIWRYLRDRDSKKEIGVIITDSHTTPLRRGVVGIALAWCGFSPTYNYIGKPDCFGKPLEVTHTNIIDSIAAASVLCMGEGAEQTPIAIAQNIPKVFFSDDIPSEEEKKGFYVTMDEDIYGALLRPLPWKYPL